MGKGTVQVEGDSPVRIGEKIGLRFVAKCLHFFDEGGLALM